MENQVKGNQFRDEEIVIMSHWDKNKEEWLRNPASFSTTP